MPIQDVEVRLLTVILVVAVSVFFLYRYPVANAFLGFCVFGLGGQPILGRFTFAMLAPCIQLGTLVRIYLGATEKRMASPAVNRLAGWFFGAIAAVWIKVLVDCGYGGIDPDRWLSLRISLYVIWLPGCILYASIERYGAERTAKGVLWALSLFSVVYVAPVLPRAAVDGRLASAASGDQRLRIFDLDSINAARMFLFGTIGFMWLSIGFRRALPARIGYGAVSVAFFLLLVLNGTRQFVGCVLVLFVCMLALSGAAKSHRGIFAGVLMAASVYSIGWFYISPMLHSRFSAESFAQEMEFGRGDIWRKVGEAATEHPLFGAGFRRFGDEVVTYDENNFIVGIGKDTAHGFFQDIVAEHGVPLALAVLLGFLLAAFEAIHLIARPRTDPNLRLLLLIILLLTLPENFSGTIADSFGYSMLAVIIGFLVTKTPEYIALPRARASQHQARWLPRA
jgi:O-antigen ligase